MSEPFVDPERLARLAAGHVVVAMRRSEAPRDTASHGHAAGQLLGSVEGLLTVAAAAGRFAVPATHAVWLPPRCAHAVLSHGPFRGWSVYVEEGACRALPPEPRACRVSPLLREIVRRAALWGDAPRTPAELRLAAVALDEIAALPAEPLGLPTPRDPRLRRVADALLAAPGDARRHDAWAASAGLSARTLSRRFVEDTGFTFTAWRQRARALAAVERLARGEAVTTVALDLGYGSVSAFIAMFRRATGATPGRYGAGPP